MLRVISSALLDPQLRSARSSAGLKLAALPRNSRTCWSASGSLDCIDRLPDDDVGPGLVPHLRRGRVGDEDALDVRAPVVGQLRLLLHHADHFEVDPANPDRLADGVAFSEQLPVHFGADERHAPVKAHVLVVEEPAARQRNLTPHLAVRRRDRANQIRALLVAVADGQLLEQLRADVLDQRQLAHLAAPARRSRARGVPRARRRRPCWSARATRSRRRCRTRCGSPRSARRGSRCRTTTASRPTRCPRRCRASPGRRGSDCAPGRTSPRGRPPPAAGSRWAPMAVPATAGRSSVEVVKPLDMRYISYRSASTGGISAARRAG